MDKLIHVIFSSLKEFHSWVTPLELFTYFLENRLHDFSASEDLKGKQYIKDRDTQLFATVQLA